MSALQAGRKYGVPSLTLTRDRLKRQGILTALMQKQRPTNSQAEAPHNLLAMLEDECKFILECQDDTSQIELDLTNFNRERSISVDDQVIPGKKILICLRQLLKLYKGEAKVPQQMLPSFIQTAESLQIRGDGASKAKLAELNTNTVASSTNNSNNNDESDSDVLKIDEDGDLVKDGRDNNEKEISEDDIAEVDNENGLDDSEEEIAMGNKEIAERTGKSPPPSPSPGSVLLV